MKPTCLPFGDILEGLTVKLIGTQVRQPAFKFSSSQVVVLWRYRDSPSVIVWDMADAESERDRRRAVAARWGLERLARAKPRICDCSPIPLIRHEFRGPERNIGV